MIKKLSPLFLIALFGLLETQASAQVFQNNNTACETELTLCDSSMNCGAGQSVATISCKNIEGPADLNEDTYPDCVASVADNPSQTKSLSVLINGGEFVAHCGNQFLTPIDYEISANSGAAFNFGSLTIGNINQDPLSIGLSDIAIANTNPTDRNIYLISSTAPFGTFGNPLNAIMAQTSNWDATQTGAQSANDSKKSDRTAVLLDCDSDQDLDFAMPVIDEVSGGLYLNIAKNKNNSLLPVNAADSFFVSNTYIRSFASITTEDFDNDGDFDLAIAINDVTLGSKISVCLNEGLNSCNFENCQTFLWAENGANPLPFSIAAGDFNGDKNIDLVASAPGLLQPKRGIKFFFGNGTGTFSNTAQKSFLVPFLIQPPFGASKHVSLTTGCFDNDNRVDVAVAYNINLNFGATKIGSTIDTIGLKQGSAIRMQESLSFPGIPSEEGGIDAADFDKKGGDDVVAIFRDSKDDLLNGDRKMAVFMNQPEDLSADAGPDQTDEAKNIWNLSGSCVLSPGDPNAEIEVIWTVTSAPAGSNPVIQNPNTLTPTVITDQKGNYEIVLSCRTRCDLVASDKLSIVAPQPLSYCGNGILEGNELCDDGNNQSGDGCSSGCTPEVIGSCALNTDSPTRLQNLLSGWLLLASIFVGARIKKRFESV